MLNAFSALQEKQKNALLIIVPRHPERFEQVFQLAKKQSFETYRKTENALPPEDAQVYIGDTMGEMLIYLALADLVIMGGSFVPVGGHNLLEPAALQKASITGPHTFNFTDITEQLIKVGHTTKVDNAKHLAQSLILHCEHFENLSKQGENGLQVVKSNQGALQKTLASL
ncbi:hypothetical protein ACLKMH_23670 [Psychromonas sp. KJ10-10]|uniref:hypothetical protein n=1 Tax=Psychromonas sp. KJ10-10 TaxID=3391823 RepID=UPI0039B52291